ncbi:MAG: ribonuclease P protein component, partial [Spirulinaceae cyanobacterium RM2_2_10]|nr:ribonuclease P protein component [Spirulinaceae cyanobacterium RM2_2_10]
SRHLTLRLRFDAEARWPARIGIAISRKVSKKAVIRNRLKRRLRAALHEFLPRLRAGAQLVFNVRASAIECEYEHFLRELRQLLTQAEVLDGH